MKYLLLFCTILVLSCGILKQPLTLAQNVKEWDKYINLVLFVILLADAIFAMDLVLLNVHTDKRG